MQLVLFIVMTTRTLIIAIGMVAGSVFGGCGESGRNRGSETRQHEEHNHDHGNEADRVMFSPTQAKSVGLEVVEVQPGDFFQVIKATGELMAPTGQEAIVSATSSGILSFSGRDLSEGTAIRAGAPLAFISAKNIAEGDPQAKLRVQYETAERAYRRAEALVSEQIISQKAYEEALLNYETAKVAYSGLQSTSSGAGVGVSSPIDGYLKNRLAEEGAFLAIGQPILTVTRNKRLRLRAEVSQKHQRYLSTIRSANFKVPFDERVYELDSLGGQLAAYGITTEPGSAFLPVSFELNNTGFLPTGAYVDVFLLTNPIPDVLSVPKTALIEEQGMYSVFIQTGESTYRKQVVALGEDNGKSVRILTGLRAGDRVVAKGAFHVKIANAGTAIPHGHSH